MPAKTKYELKLGAATREAFGKALVELGRSNPERGGAGRGPLEIHLHRRIRERISGPLLRMRHRRSEHGGHRRGPGIVRENSVRLQLLGVR